MQIFRGLLFAVSCFITFVLFLYLQALGRPLLSNHGPVQFRDVTQTAGIDFTHVRAPTPEKYLVEVMGSGCAFFDYDADGWLDIFLVNGGRVPGFQHSGEIEHALFRNLHDGTFQNVSEQAGIRGSPHYGMGMAVGDYNNDGFDDFYLTYFGGPNQVYRNNGNGTFTDVTSSTGLAADGKWSTSAAFFDYNNDGFLDLYVCRYLDLDYKNNRVCGPLLDKGYRVYCSPKIYDGVPDLLFRNNGDGTFADVSSESGISSLAGKSLGVVAADIDEDGWMDIYVANDTDPNYLFRNKGDGTFQELALLAGVALSENGEAQSGMGVSCADYDNDGLFDLVVTNLDDPQYMAVYRNLGKLHFEDVSSRVGVQQSSSKYVGFGVGFSDFDNDADLDLFVANGHVDDLVHVFIPEGSFEQPKLLYENKGHRFEEVTSQHGAALLKKQVSRGVAFGDYDNDGDEDILVSNCGAGPMLLRNDGGNQQHWLRLRLNGTKSNRNAIGSIVTLESDKGTRKLQLVGGGSYLSASDRTVHVGLGSDARVSNLQIRWPRGTVDKLGPVDSNQLIVLEEGETAKAK